MIPLAPLRPPPRSGPDEAPASARARGLSESAVAEAMRSRGAVRLRSLGTAVDGGRLRLLRGAGVPYAEYAVTLGPRGIHPGRHS